MLMSTPDYSVGKHPWPDAFSVPSGCQPIGLEDGMAFFFDKLGIICTIPISVLRTTQDSGYQEGLDELSCAGVKFAVLDEVITNPLSNSL